MSSSLIRSVTRRCVRISASISSLVAKCLVDVVHLARVDVVDAVLLQHHDREQHDFRLGRESPHHLDHAVQFDLVLRATDVRLRDPVGLVALGEFARGPEQVERATGVTVLLGGERRAQRDHVLGERIALERGLRAVLEDIA